MGVGHCLFLLFVNATSTTEIYTLSLHDALPIYAGLAEVLLQSVGDPEDTAELADVLAHEHNLRVVLHRPAQAEVERLADGERDRKSTRLNSSHSQISYAVFCLKKKKKYRHAAFE